MTYFYLVFYHFEFHTILYSRYAWSSALKPAVTQDEKINIEIRTLALKMILL